MPELTDHDLLLEILAEVCQLRAQLCSRLQKRTDPEAEDQLLAAVAEGMGESAFAVGDVLVASQRDGRLAAVLTAAGLTDARSIGAALRRLRGRRLGPYRLDAVGREKGGTVWCISVDSHLTYTSAHRNRPPRV